VYGGVAKKRALLREKSIGIKKIIENVMKVYY